MIAQGWTGAPYGVKVLDKFGSNSGFFLGSFGKKLE